ncbi:unnamed protein product [Somion occarium]|uniref:Uncharacterized protein n=1 Tax=Somion occarium TaxID=3059160 RepID=A0ABP1CTN6_9APHY
MSVSSALLPHAITIVDGLPALIENALRHDVDNNILENQCASHRSYIGVLEKSIAQERLEQSIIRSRISAIRGNTTQPESLPSFLASPDGPVTTIRSAPSKKEYTSLLTSPDPPVSTRNKRKGTALNTDERVIKKIRLANNAGPRGDAATGSVPDA